MWNVKVELKSSRVWLKRDPLRLRTKHNLAKVQHGGPTWNGNLPLVK